MRSRLLTRTEYAFDNDYDAGQGCDESTDTEFGNFTGRREKSPSRIFHVRSHTFPNANNPLVIHLAMDEAIRFLFLWMSQNHLGIVLNNQGRGWKTKKLDAVAEKISFLALLEDITSRYTPTTVFYSTCPMIH